MRFPGGRSAWHGALIGAVVATVPAWLHAQDRRAVTPVLDSWWSRTSHHSPGKWGVVVADQSGTVLWQVNQDEPMIPASTVKVLTTGFARTSVVGDASRPRSMMSRNSSLL